MSTELPPQIQNQVAQLQQLQQQAQALAVQRSQLELALNEANQTLVELDKLDEKAVIFKTVGTILVRSNKDEVKAELTEKKETNDVRLKSLERQEERVQTRFQQLQQQLQKALGGGVCAAGRVAQLLAPTRLEVLRGFWVSFFLVFRGKLFSRSDIGSWSLAQYYNNVSEIFKRGRKPRLCSENDGLFAMLHRF
jgi:prefoldin beta subunit